MHFVDIFEAVALDFVSEQQHDSGMEYLL